MPIWLVNLLAQLAIQFGIPYLLKVIPGIPPAVIEIIEELLKKLQDPKVSNSSARKSAIHKIKKCTVGCPPETKSDK